MSIWAGNDLARMKFQLSCRLRKELGFYKQSEAAEIVGTSQSAVSAFLSGSRRLRLGTLVNWLEALGIKVEFRIAPDHPSQGIKQ